MRLLLLTVPQRDAQDPEYSQSVDSVGDSFVAADKEDQVELTGIRVVTDPNSAVEPCLKQFRGGPGASASLCCLTNAAVDEHNVVPRADPPRPSWKGWRKNFAFLQFQTQVPLQRPEIVRYSGQPGDQSDKMKSRKRARYISATGAAWRIMGFQVNSRAHSSRSPASAWSGLCCLR